MTEDWREELTDERERRVFEALADDTWDFRTLDGLSRATGLGEGEVVEILEGHPELVRKSYVPDKLGRDLYTLQTRGHTKGEFLQSLKTFLSKSVG